MARQWARVVMDLPEVNIGIFAFLLSFPWEILQSPFFQGMTAARHGVAVRICTLATLGDVGLMLLNFLDRGVGRRWTALAASANYGPNGRLYGVGAGGHDSVRNPRHSGVAPLALQRSHADDPHPGCWPHPAPDVGCAAAPCGLLRSPTASGGAIA